MKKILGFVVGCFLVAQGHAATLYVDLNSSSPVLPYNSWGTAATSIQAAVDAASSNDTVLVADGTYNQGGALAPGSALTNRVCVTDAITIQSLNGPEHTTIVGRKNPTGSYTGPGAVRGVYLAAGATLSGFTITDGHTLAAGSLDDRSGGGVFGEQVSPGESVVTNCVLTGNTSSDGRGGGGAYYCILNNCRIINNSTTHNGGGASGSTLNNCLLENNSAYYGGGLGYCEANACIVTNNQSWYKGGGVYDGNVYNCLIIGNSSSTEGGGSYQASLYNSTVTQNTSKNRSGGGIYSAYYAKNCIIVSNTAATGGQNYVNCTFFQYNCTSPSPGTSSRIYGNIVADPLFVNAAAGDCRLQAGSLCINAANNPSQPPGNDLQGAPRPLDVTVDMGCYEYFLPEGDLDGDLIPNQWEVANGLDLTNALDVATDPDSDGSDNWDEYIADTDPVDPQDYFQVVADSLSGDWTCRFDSSANRIYTLLFSSSLTYDTWNSVPSVPPRAGVGGQDSFTISTNLNSGFIKLTVELP